MQFLFWYDTRSFFCTVESKPESKLFLCKISVVKQKMHNRDPREENILTCFVKYIAQVQMQ